MLAKRLFKNISFLVCGDMLSNILQFVFIIYLGKAFGEAGVGKYSFVFSLIMVFSVFSDLGIGTYIVREVSKNREDRTIIANALFVRVLAIIFYCCLLFSTVMLFRKIFTDEKMILIFLMGLYQVFFGIADIFIAEFKGHEKMDYAASLGFLLKVIVVALGLLLIIMNCSLVEVLIVLPIGAFIYLSIAFALSIKTFGFLPLSRVDHKKIKLFLRDITPFGISVILLEMIGRQEILILSFLKGDEAAGIYTIGLKITTFMLGFTVLFQISVLPVLSNYFISSRKQLLDVSERLINYLLIVGIPTSTGFYCLAEKIINLLYKDKFYESIIVLKVTSCFVAISLFQALFSSLLAAINKQNLKAYAVGVSLLLSIILNILIVPRFSYVGAAFVRITSEIITSAICVFFIYKYLSYVPFWKYTYKPIIASLVMALMISWSHDLSLLIIIPIGVATYFISLTVIGGLRKNDFAMIKRIFTFGDERETV